MKITDMQTNQGSKNTVRPVDNSNPAIDKRMGPSVHRMNFSVSSAKKGIIKTPKVGAQGINASFNYIREQLDEVLVHYPPFFPIAKYQRLDLIEKVKGIEETLESLSIDENLKDMTSGKKLTDEATDEELSRALDKFFHLRDTLTKNESVLSDIAKIGSILNIKV